MNEVLIDKNLKKHIINWIDDEKISIVIHPGKCIIISIDYLVVNNYSQVIVKV